MAAAAPAYVIQGVGKVSVSIDRPWLARYDPGGPRSLTYPAIALPQLLRDTAARHPAAAATPFGGRVAGRLGDPPRPSPELGRLSGRVAAAAHAVHARARAEGGTPSKGGRGRRRAPLPGRAAAGLRAGAGRRAPGGPRGAPVHRRDDGCAEGRDVVAPRPRRKRAAESRV